jgi:hypothetical protein
VDGSDFSQVCGVRAARLSGPLEDPLMPSFAPPVGPEHDPDWDLDCGNGQELKVMFTNEAKALTGKRTFS